jgi:hypothetical protein
MSRIRTLSVAALVMALAVAASSARAADENKKTDSAIHGAVTAVTPDAVHKDVGTFTVKLAKKKDAAADAATPEPMTFQVTKDTTFAIVARKKKGDTAAPAEEAATFAELKVDDVVVVESKMVDNKLVATSVKFHAPGKKKPAA